MYRRSSGEKRLSGQDKESRIQPGEDLERDYIPGRRNEREDQGPDHQHKVAGDQSSQTQAEIR